MAAKDVNLNLIRADDHPPNAYPLRQVIPVNSADIARALRTVWLRSVCRPEKRAPATADFNMRQGQATMDTWNEA